MTQIHNTVKFLLILPVIFYCQSKQSNFNSEFTKERLKRHIEVLGSDLFEGRGTGTKGGELAASYIAEVFKSLDLSPIGDDDNYYQAVPLHGTNFLYESKLYLYSDKDTVELRIGRDYLLSNSGEQTYIPTASELVFVGYGIIAPEYDHNDYLGKDVSGKIVVMFDGEPDSDDLDFFNGREPTIHGYPDVKHRVAISRGAEGTIIIPNISTEDQEAWNNLVNEYSFEDVRLSYNASNSFGIIMNPRIARKYFCNTSSLSSNLMCTDITIDKYSLKFEGEFFVRDFKSNNVVGMIGDKSDKEQEYIIISAHYDHLGIGQSINGDAIYNGVLDNAIGVAGLIEVARGLKKIENNLDRSIIFIATTGEEKGLLGSTYYVDHPIVPLYKTIANVNIDGLAFIDDFRALIGIGGELSDLGSYLNKTAQNLGLTVESIPEEFFSHESFNRSDQIAFAKAGIPSILIMDAPNYVNLSRQEAIEKIINFNSQVYHTPFDDLNIKLNYYAMSKHVKILIEYIAEISNSEVEIDWMNGVHFNIMRLQTIAEKR